MAMTPKKPVAKATVAPKPKASAKPATKATKAPTMSNAKRPAVGTDIAAKKKYGAASHNNGYTN